MDGNDGAALAGCCETGVDKIHGQCLREIQRPRTMQHRFHTHTRDDCGADSTYHVVDDSSAGVAAVAAVVVAEAMGGANKATLQSTVDTSARMKTDNCCHDRGRGRGRGRGLQCLCVRPSDVRLTTD